MVLPFLTEIDWLVLPAPATILVGVVSGSDNIDVAFLLASTYSSTYSPSFVYVILTVALLADTEQWI